MLKNYYKLDKDGIALKHFPT